MSAEKIEVLQATLDQLWSKTDKGPAVQIQKTRQDDGSPHLELQENGFTIVTTERGQETDRQMDQSDSDVINYYLVSMASAHALRQELSERRRSEGAEKHGDGYSRWNWMAPAIVTMRAISKKHGDWAKIYYADILRQSPLNVEEIKNARWPR